MDQSIPISVICCKQRHLLHKGVKLPYTIFGYIWLIGACILLFILEKSFQNNRSTSQIPHPAPIRLMAVTITTTKNKFNIPQNIYIPTISRNKRIENRKRLNESKNYDNIVHKLGKHKMISFFYSLFFCLIVLVFAGFTAYFLPSVTDGDR